MPNEADWELDDPAVQREFAPGNQREAVSLRHANYPFVATWATRDPDEVVQIAARYLQKVSPAFALPPDLLEPNLEFAERASGLQLTWLPLEPHKVAADALRDPRNSFWVRRYKNPENRTGLIDLTAVVLAVQSTKPNKPRTAVGSRMGIKIVAHVFPRGNGPWQVHVTSATCSADLVDALKAGGPQTSEFAAPFVTPARGARNKLKAEISGVAALEANSRVGIDGLRIITTAGNQAELHVYGKVQRPPARLRLSDPGYAFVARTTVTVRGPGQVDIDVKSVLKHELFAHAAVKPRLFPQDPASQKAPPQLIAARAHRSPEKLKPYRTAVTLPGLTADGGGNTTLTEDLGWIEVRKSRIVGKNEDENNPEVVRPAGVDHPRRNDFAALSGYQHARTLFDCLRGYGFSPVDYFKFAAPPLLIRYRAPMSRGRGRDGRTVNAEVDYDPLVLDISEDATTASVKPLQVRFALADMRRSWSHREPLGLTADPRWSWHEYGHVLLAASTGALEFRFAHSAGDALAAIACDPYSMLARHLRLRYATYPWVYLNRRHDRSVWEGWSWSGTYHRPEGFSTDPEVWPHRRKGYQSEQILSTSLFRVYRALGGDDVKNNGKPHKVARQRAADYVLYLIMKAINSLPPPNAGPVQSPEQLVTALMEADTSTLPASTGPLAGRVGGIAHKVVMWSFEQQGLFSPAGPNVIHNAPGNPPPVDVYIDNRRPASSAPVPRGGYMPVSLDWHQWPNPRPWHAEPNAIQVSAVNQVTVEVFNRGAAVANGVQVRVWCAPWDGTGNPPDWNAGAWQLLGDLGPLNVPAAGGPATSFGPFALPPLPAPPMRFLILAEASCAADLANSRSALPCATEITPIVDLVAGDNNLALRVFP